MKDQKKKRLLKRKIRNWIISIAFTLFLLIIILTQQYWFFIAFLLVFVFFDVCKSDHIFYNPKKDYAYKLQADKTFLINISKKGYLDFKTNYVPCILSDHVSTWLLPIKITASLSGKIFDPFVEVIGHEYKNRQFFERGSDGLRYINLTAVMNHCKDDPSSIRLRFHYCRVTESLTKLLRFDHPSFSEKKILIIAPHADDAEIAAFGLYSQAKTNIVTLTAGEIQAEPFQSYYKKIEDASTLKGSLRAWDSVAIPIFGGVNQESCINLGYFCMTLKAMHADKTKALSSKQSHISDTRYFRKFNKLQITSDQHGQASWNNLVSDICEMIDHTQPDVVVMNDFILDTHEDHIYAHHAVKEALLQSNHTPEYLLYYCNHYANTNLHPFGNEHSIASLAPYFDYEAITPKVYSFTLSYEQQINKICALKMMHDLQTPKKWKKKRREWLQSLFIKRPVNRYGDDLYFRKSIMENELFFWEKYVKNKPVSDSFGDSIRDNNDA